MTALTIENILENRVNDCTTIKYYISKIFAKYVFIGIFVFINTTIMKINKITYKVTTR